MCINFGAFIKKCTILLVCRCTITLLLLSTTSFQLKEQFNLPIIKGYTLHYCTPVQEGSGYPTNGTSTGVSISILAHLATKRIIFTSYREAKVII